MCFIKKKRFSLPKIAKTDIPCYKIVKKNNEDLRGFIKYESGKFHSVRFKLFEILFSKKLTRGIKSFIITYTDLKSPESDKYRGVLCKIPKGARYYENREKDQYVSEKLIYDFRDF